MSAALSDTHVHVIPAQHADPAADVPDPGHPDVPHGPRSPGELRLCRGPDLLQEPVQDSRTDISPGF